MTFVKMPLKDAKAPEALPEGQYTLIIEQADQVEESAGRSHVMIRHSVVGEPEASAVFHRLPITLPDDANKAKWAMLFCKAYLKTFGIEYKGTGYDPDLVEPGLQAECFLERSEYNGVISNRIKLNPQDV